MLEAAGDLGLEQEPLAADRVVGVVVEDLLERHLAVQLAVERHEDRPQAARAWGRSTRNRWPSLVAVPTDSVMVRSSSPSALDRARADAAERRLDVRAADPCQALLRRLTGRDRGQALLHVAAVGFQVDLGQRFQQRPLGGSQVASGFQVVGQAPDLSSVQAWKAATSWTWLMIPFCSASSPKRRWRSAAVVMGTLRGPRHPPRHVQPQPRIPVARGASQGTNSRILYGPIIPASSMFIMLARRVRTSAPSLLSQIRAKSRYLQPASSPICYFEDREESGKPRRPLR